VLTPLSFAQIFVIPRHAWAFDFVAFVRPEPAAMSWAGASRSRINCRTANFFVVDRVFLLIIVWTPERLGEAVAGTESLSALCYLLLILWMATVTAARGECWRLVLMVCAEVLMAHCIPIHAARYRDIEGRCDVPSNLAPPSCCLIWPSADGAIKFRRCT